MSQRRYIRCWYKTNFQWLMSYRKRSPGCTMSVASESNVDTLSKAIYDVSNQTVPSRRRYVVSHWTHTLKWPSTRKPEEYHGLAWRLERTLGKLSSKPAISLQSSAKMHRMQKVAALGGTRTPGSSIQFGNVTTNAYWSIMAYNYIGTVCLALDRWRGWSSLTWVCE